MNFWKRVKNIFTNELVLPSPPAEPVKETVHQYAIDWDFIGIPFSIERCLSDDKVPELITSIGYYPLTNLTNEPLEWFLPLNDEQHNELVKSFNEWKRNQDVDSLIGRIKGKHND